MEEYHDQDTVNVKLVIENAANFFGINAIKHFQLEAATAALLGKDVFLAKPTGSGKSLVFQILPFAHFELQKMMGNELSVPGFAIVISPLIALMKDQVQRLTDTVKESGKKLEKARQDAYLEMFNAVSLSDKKGNLSTLKDKKIAFLYFSPESILSTHLKDVRTRWFQERLLAVIIGESHCIIKWDITSRKVSAFRSCYGQIAKLRFLFTSPVPFIALTATATSTTVKAISQNLELDDASYNVSIPDRSNIRYSVVKIKEERLDKMFD
eukprot:gene13252-14614_t